MSVKFKVFSSILFIFIQFIIFFSCKVGDNQSTDTPGIGSELTEQQRRLIQELDQWLIPLGTSFLELTDNELSFLDQMSFARIVGLGEATHGTHEFFQMKHRIFQYLVENLNYKAFGFEADFAESIYLNNYITTGEGNLEEIMRTRMHFWVWRTEEVKELLEWMKNYNMGKSDEEKIHFVGFDCQFTDLQPDLIRGYLEPLLPDLWETVSPVLDQVKDFVQSNYEQLSNGEYESIKTQLESMETQFAANKNQLVNGSSLNEYEITMQLFRTVRQAFISNYTFYHNDLTWRDRYMAENARWIADFFGQNTKIALWAHNAHIAKNRSYLNGGAMGYHLQTVLGDSYQALGFGFSQGKFNAIGNDTNPQLGEKQITDEPRQTSVNFIFHHAANLNFAFHLDAIPAGSEWDNWLSNPVPFLWIGANFNGNPLNYYWDSYLSENYNWIIYIDTTNASILF
jgi:erythromycin esterase